MLQNWLIKCYADENPYFSGVFFFFFNSSEFIRIFYPRCLICHLKRSLYGCEDTGGLEGGLVWENWQMGWVSTQVQVLSQAGWNPPPHPPVSSGRLPNPAQGLGPPVYEMVMSVLLPGLLEDFNRNNIVISLVFTVLTSPGLNSHEMDCVLS